MNDLIYNYDDPSLRYQTVLLKEIHPNKITNHQVVNALVSIFGLWMMIAMTMIYGEVGYAFLNLNLFPLTLFGGGLLATIYYQVRNQKESDHFSSLTLKTNNAFVNNWFISAFLFPAVITLLFWSYSIFADELFYHYSGEQISTFHLIEGWSIPYLEVYFGLQFIYLIGFFVFQKIPVALKIIGQFFYKIFTVFLCVLAVRILLIDYLKSFLFQQLTNENK